MSAEMLLPAAPPVVRAPQPVRAVRRGPALALLLLGALLVVAPAATGLFTKVAAGQQLIDRFAPHLQPDALARYHQDLAKLLTGERAVTRVYAHQHVPAGRYPGLDQWQQRAGAVEAHASGLLATVESARPDYDAVASISGFDRIPFLVVVAGLAIGYGGIALLVGRRRATAGVLAALVGAVALGAYPFASGLMTHAHAGGRLLDRLTPVVTPIEVVQLQRDFVVVVQAVGELETAFHGVPRASTDAKPIERLVHDWPAISSDLASLTGDLNDSIPDVRALRQLDEATGPVHGFIVLPWALVGLAAVVVVLALVSSIPAPSPRKDRP